MKSFLQKTGDAMYKYETHLHTFPVSKCGKVTIEEQLSYYKSLGYEGVFVTNHFLDGNINMDRSAPYEDLIEFYFSDYEKGRALSREYGIKVFDGVELSYKGTDFLVYGLDKAWFLAHPEIREMKKSEELAFMREEGALIIQAHPYREAAYIDHIRLFPRQIEGVEIVNSTRTELENEMARLYQENYGLLPFAGSDNHSAALRKKLAGLSFETPLESEADFIARVRAQQFEIFELNLEE